MFAAGRFVVVLNILIVFIGCSLGGILYSSLNV